VHRLRLALVLLTAIGFVAGCGAQPRSAAPDESTLGPKARFPDLANSGRHVSLFSLFNAQQEIPRVVLLISPT
jgi:hypothetical protein